MDVRARGARRRAPGETLGVSLIDALLEARGVGRLLAGSARVAVLQASRRAHPIVEGRLTVDGCNGMLEVLRDRYGVPHVFATSEGDALFGQGLVHAQDRLFQMEALRRLAAGRLAEVLGPRVLTADRFHRRLGLAKLAHRDVLDAAPEDRTALEAYARGVNAGLATLRALPPEFALLGFDPEPWQAWHSALVGRLLLFTFATNWDTELLREELLRLLGPERAAVSESGLRVSSANGERSTSVSYVPGVLERLLAAHRAAQEAGVAVGLPTGGGASNAFAVGPGRSTTGAPLLAADPHLSPRLPGFFHLVHLAGGGLNVVGADVAGLPGVAMGHNGALAWGLTAGLADVADCYVEDLDPADPGRYRTPEGWETGRWRLETIKVRGAAPVEERVLETRHGPVIGPALPGEQRAIALHATPLQPSDAVSPFLALGRARKIEAFEAALERWPGSTFNVIYAHVDGRIGYQLAGQVPIREHGEGLLPRVGARSPGPPPSRAVSELPRLINPASGVVLSANEAPDSLLELGEEWAEPWRASRIEQLLAARELHDTSSRH